MARGEKGMGKAESRGCIKILRAGSLGGEWQGLVNLDRAGPGSAGEGGVASRVGEVRAPGRLGRGGSGGRGGEEAFAGV